MADGTIGNSAINRATDTYHDVGAGWTILDYNNGASCGGELYKIEYWLGYEESTPDWYIRVYRESGSNFVYVNGTHMTSSVGTGAKKTLDLTGSEIDVEEGDYIGIWCANVGNKRIGVDNDTSGTSYKINSSQTGTSAKSSWTSDNITMSLYGYIEPIEPIKKSAGFFAFFCESWQRHDKLWRNNKLVLPSDLGFSY